ncbi:MAG: NADH-quinone oxidoreductase subunit K [Verrucomicrobia bacterium]|nr:NADH-quinone oxidoreductase subunit K [Verrucomicrobiota bacterium]
MQIETALLIGALFACGTYLVLQTSFVRILFGFIVLSNAANLVLLSMSGNPSGKAAPIVPLTPAGANPAALVDPLPQALILTAIVIGFGVTAYLVLLLYRLFLDQRTTNAAELYADQDTSEHT